MENNNQIQHNELASDSHFERSDIQSMLALRANSNAEILYYSTKNIDIAKAVLVDSLGSKDSDIVKKITPNILFTVVRLLKLGESIQNSLVTKSQKDIAYKIISREASENRRTKQLNELRSAPEVNINNSEILINTSSDGSLQIDRDTCQTKIRSIIADLLEEKPTLDIELLDRESDVVILAELKYKIRETVLNLIRGLNKTIELLGKKEDFKDDVVSLKYELERLKQIFTNDVLGYDEKLLFEILTRLENHYESIKTTKDSDDIEADRAVCSLKLDIIHKYLPEIFKYKTDLLSLRLSQVDSDRILNAEAQVMAQKYYQITLDLIRNNSDLSDVLSIFTGTKTNFEAFTAPLYTEKSLEVRKIVADDIVTQLQAKIQKAKEMLPETQAKLDEYQQKYDAVHEVVKVVDKLKIENHDIPFIAKKPNQEGYYIRLEQFDAEEIIQAEEGLNSIEDIIKDRSLKVANLEVEFKQKNGQLIKFPKTNARISALSEQIAKLNYDLIALNKIKDYSIQLGLIDGQNSIFQDQSLDKDRFFTGLPYYFSGLSDPLSGLCGPLEISSIPENTLMLEVDSSLRFKKELAAQLKTTIQTGEMLLQKAQYESDQI